MMPIPHYDAGPTMIHTMMASAFALGSGPSLRGAADCLCDLPGGIMIFMGSTVPIIWAVLVLFAALTALLLYLGLFQDRSRGRPRCPKCWYNMTEAPSLVCPECGHDARTPRRLHRTRRRRWAIMLAVLTAFCCYYSWLVRVRVVELEEPVSVALRPTSYLLATLPKARPVQLMQLRGRANRFGLRPWESELLLLALDPIMSAKGPSPEQAIWLLSIAAETSNRALNKLVDLREFTIPGTNYYPVFASMAAHVGRSRDDQLIALLDSAMKLSRLHSHDAPDAILIEMARRNRPGFKEQIAHWAAHPPEDPTFKTKTNLELLTTLRRMDGKPDPLHVFLDGPQAMECTSGNLPTINVRIVNVDVETQAVGFQTGGDYRSGRQARWRLEVRDEQDRLMPVKPRMGVGGGGISSFGMLQPGKSYETKLEVAKYVEPLAPGRYRAVVLYHNSATIADREDISGLIVSSSDPFELIVRPAGAESPPARQ